MRDEIFGMDVCRALGTVTFQPELPTLQGIPCRMSLLLQRQTMVSVPPGPTGLAARAEEELFGAFGFTEAQEPFPELEPDTSGEQAGQGTRGRFACSSLSVVSWCF